MWTMVTGIAVMLAQAAPPGPGSKGYEWCFNRGQGAVQFRIRPFLAGVGGWRFLVNLGPLWIDD
jgi:hypothetical protein